MRTRKYALPLLALVIIGVIGIGVLLGHSKLLAILPGSQSSKLKANREYHYSAAAQEQATERAQHYLTDRLNQIPPIERLILDYLQRKYGLDRRFSATVTPITFAEQSGEDPDEYAALRRIAYPNDLVDKLSPRLTDPVTLMNITAANCDHIPLPKDFKNLPETNIDKGGYFLTHVMFALKMMKDNSCSYYSEADTTKISNQVAEKTTALITRADTIPDLRYEAIAFLLDSGRRDLVQEAWMGQIIAEQQPDGGWRLDKLQPNSDHTTMLALWALLAYTQPDVANEAMIRRPAKT